MRKLLLFAVLLAACMAHAQMADTVSAQNNATSAKRLLPEQQEVWSGEEKHFRLLAQKDLKNYMSLWDDGFLGWPDYVEHPVRKPAIEASAAEEFHSPQPPGPPLPAPSPEEIGLFGNVAITTYFWPEADHTSPFIYRIIHTWQKGAQGWHIIGGMSCEVPRSSPSASPPSSTKNDAAAVEAVVRGYEEAVQQFDYARVNTFLAPNAKWIERSAPESAAFGSVVTGFWGEAKAAQVRLTNQPHDVDVHIDGNMAWVTLFVDVTAIADNEVARQLLARTEVEETGKPGNPSQREWRATYTESEVLTKTAEGWKIILGHTSRLPEKSN